MWLLWIAVAAGYGLWVDMAIDWLQIVAANTTNISECFESGYDTT